MKTCWISLAALFAAASLAWAEAPPPAAETPAPTPLTRFSLGAGLSYWHIEDLATFDVEGALGGSVVGQFQLHELLTLELRLSGFAAGDSDDIYVEGEGWFENEITIVAMPMEIGLVAFLPLGDTFRLYGGGGAGFYVFDGQFRTEQGPRETTYDIEMDDEGGFYVVLGAKAQLVRNVALFAEAKYTWVETSLEQSDEFLAGIGIEGIESELDFSGLALGAGMLFTF